MFFEKDNYVPCGVLTAILMKISILVRPWGTWNQEGGSYTGDFE